MGTTFAILSSSGTIPESRETLIIWVNGSDIMEIVSLSNFDDMSSCPLLSSIIAFSASVFSQFITILCIVGIITQ